jgi:hypothetical protein
MGRGDAHCFPTQRLAPGEKLSSGCLAGPLRRWTRGGDFGGHLHASRDNKRYALRAVELLIAEPSLAEAEPKVLWERVMDGEPKAYNSQMDVVLVLWRSGLITPASRHA